ncbi:MAG TPA: hypothetical protein PLI06_05530 [Methanofastidiosum sp.]|nr:hypothetical protein [Methanofastidiosum sp.]
MEQYEYISFKLVEKVLGNKYNEFTKNIKNIHFDEMFQFLSRQGSGRARTLYDYDLRDVLESCINSSLDREKEKELRWRLASSPLYKVAIERFVNENMTKWFVENEIEYSIYYSPNSSDYAVVLTNNSYTKIAEILDLDFEINENYDGGLLLVDSKSLNALGNLGDSLVEDEVGLFEAKWNQISYEPPLLKKAKTEHPDPLMAKKHSVLPQITLIENKKYVTVTCFAVGLNYLAYPSPFFTDPLNTLSSKYFDIILYIVNVPNGVQGNKFDRFFFNGKGGYDESNPNYPVDCRIGIKNNGIYLRFEDIEGNPKRFSHFPSTPRFYNISLFKNRGIIGKRVKVGEVIRPLC